MEHSDVVVRFSAIISAGGQAGEDLALLLGVQEKCAAAFRGKPLVSPSIEAALGADADEVAIVCGPEVRSKLGALCTRCVLADPGENPVASAASGLRTLRPPGVIVFLPGDLPLLHAGAVCDFVNRLPVSDAPWVAAGITSDKEVDSAFGRVPGMRYVKLNGMSFAGGGLFAASYAGFEVALKLLNEFAGDRKSLFKMARRFGLANLATYFLGFMSIEGAERAGSRLFGCRAHVVARCAPESVMDVDTAEDWEFLTKLDYPTTGASSST